MKVQKIIWFVLLCMSCQPDKEYTYYNNGSVESEFERGKDGKLHGKVTYFYPTGEKQASEHYNNGKKTGYSILYYKSGEIQAIRNYKDDQPYGLFSYYRKDGTIEGVDKYDKDSVISSVAFDSTGSFNKSTYNPVFIALTDTITYGDSYSFKIGFNSEPLGRVKILAGRYDNDTNMLTDTIAFRTIDQKTAKLSFYPQQRGDISITGKIEDYFKIDRDSMQIAYTNSFVFEKTIYVK